MVSAYAKVCLFFATTAAVSAAPMMMSAADIMKMLDANKDGKMTLEEAKAREGMDHVMGGRENEMKGPEDAFLKADTDKSDDVDMAELEAFLAKASALVNELRGKTSSGGIYVLGAAVIIVAAMMAQKLRATRDIRRAPPVL